MKKSLVVSLVLMGLGLASLNGQSSYAFSAGDLQQLKSTGSCPKCDLSGADLSNINLNKANLNGANLSNANLTNAKIIDSDLRSVNFSGAIIQNTNVYGTQIAISSLTKAQNNGLIFQKPSAVLVEKEGKVLPSSPPIQDSFVSLTHEGGYVANYTLMYMRDQNFGGTLVPIPKVETGTLTLGFTKKFDIPKDAKNVNLKVEAVGKGGYVIDTNIPVGKPKCFKMFGTIFDPKYAENTCSSF